MDEKVIKAMDAEFTKAEKTEKPAEPVKEPAPTPAAEPEMNNAEKMLPGDKSPEGIFNAAAQEAEVISAQEQPEAKAAPPEEVPAARDYEAEWRELTKAHPEVVGKEFPDDILKAIIESGEKPLAVYDRMMLAKVEEENNALKREIETLRQNAETAARAPVKAMSGSGTTKQEPEDPFLAGFNHY